MLKRMRTYLGVIFAIFARDVKRVLRNPVALVIALGMIVMPSAYAWYVVAANWDPYSNTADMLVAVANEDAGADSPETGHLDVGAQVVAQLHDNHEMGWEFTDAEAAINGVYEGRYWAALVIPKDFSEDFAQRVHRRLHPADHRLLREREALLHRAQGNRRGGQRR